MAILYKYLYSYINMTNPLFDFIHKLSDKYDHGGVCLFKNIHIY